MLLEKLNARLAKIKEAQTVLYTERHELNQAIQNCTINIIAEEKLFAGEWEFSSINSDGITLTFPKYLYDSPELMALLALDWDQGAFYTDMGDFYIDDNLIYFNIPESKLQLILSTFDIHVTYGPLNKQIEQLEQQLATANKCRTELLERLKL
jgi:hypothetical protein